MNNADATMDVGVVIVVALVFLLTTAVTFFFWRRVAVTSTQETWRTTMLGALLACALFAACFTLGVCFSIIRLRGGGWFQLV